MRKMVTEFGSTAYLATASATVSAGATSGRHGTLVSLSGGAVIDMVTDVMIQTSNGEWVHLQELPPQYECAEGTKDTDVAMPTAWILVEYDREISAGVDTTQSRQILVVPPSDATYNLRVKYLPAWADAAASNRVMIDSGNMDWVVYDVGRKIATRDEQYEAVQFRALECARLEDAMKKRIAKEGAPVRSRIALRKAKVGTW
jgi:hypothetical protein